jgi:hypothetical protein
MTNEYQSGQFGMGIGNYSTDTTNLLSDQGLMQFAGNQGIDINKLNPQELQGLSESYKGLGNTLNVDDGLGGQDTSLFGMNTGEWDNAMKAGQLGMGAGQLGLGIAGYFQNRGLADKQKEVLGQQIESNRAEIDSRKNYRNALGSFGQ